MSRPLCLFAAVSLLALPAAAAARDETPDVKTGLRVVATVTYLPGRPSDKTTEPVPVKGAAVKVFAEDGDKAVAEAKTDDKGLLVVALPPGKYRVEVAPPSAGAGKAPAKVEVKEGILSEAKVHFVVPLR